MNLGNEIIIKSVNPDDARFTIVIIGAIGNPSQDKVLEVYKSYKRPNHEIIGAFIDDILVGCLGLRKASSIITIRHISVLEDFQKQGIGTLLLVEIKKRYKNYKIIAETDQESVDFYIRSGFTYHAFKQKHRKLKYKCEFLNEF